MDGRRPQRSPSQPKRIPPKVPPTKKTPRKISPHCRTAGSLGLTRRISASICPRVKLKICPSKASKIQPADAMSTTSHWYRVMPRYQDCSVAAGVSRELISKCDQAARLHRLLRAETHGHGPATILARSRHRRSTPNGRRHRRDLVSEFEDFAAGRVDWNVDDLLAIVVFERKGG